MQDPWLAVDGITSPRARARQLHRAWERYRAGRPSPDDCPAGVRAPIAESWQRSSAAGFDSSGWFAPLEVERSEMHERWTEHPLAKALEALSGQLREIEEDTESLVVVSDASGLLLRILGDEALQERAAGDANFVEGAAWSEAAAGTNAVGLAIAANHPVQVFAAEHFNENVHRWTCSAAPVHDPLTGSVVGIVDLTGPEETVHRLLLPLATAFALTMERSLAEAQRDDDDRLRRRYGDLLRTNGHALVTEDGRLLSEPAARLTIPEGGGAVVLPNGSAAVAERLGDGEAYLVRELDSRSRIAPSIEVLRFAALGTDRIELEVDGQPCRLSRRHSEVLVLLADSVDGLTAEQLAIALRGDEGKPVSARAEVSRMRALLGRRIGAEPYRLEGPSESDIDTVRRLLRQGRVAEAAELHGEGVLPRSEAPGVIELRDELESWTRNAVMTSDDPDALWSWLSRPARAHDLPAWLRFLSTVAYEDGRRSLAAAHVARLRRELAPAAR